MLSLVSVGVFLDPWWGGYCWILAGAAVQKAVRGSVWPGLCWTSLWFKTSSRGFATLWQACSRHPRGQNPRTFSMDCTLFSIRAIICALHEM